MVRTILPNAFRPLVALVTLGVGQAIVWAAALGLPHTVLRWEGPKPRSRLQETARKARYDLLIEHARKVGADAIATATNTITASRLRVQPRIFFSSRRNTAKPMKITKIDI